MYLILERNTLKLLALYKELDSKELLDINCCQLSTESFSFCAVLFLILSLAYTYEERHILEFVLKGA